jgi:hypothetical protein
MGVRGDMGEGNSSYQPWERASGLVPIGQSYPRPLLPYEREFIELAGCTEEEYQAFVEQVYRQACVRPAEYDHIPDIRADAGLIVAIVSLVVGLASTAISFFLMPKPAGGGGQRTLTSRSGNDRFAQSSGFDSTAELAQYGEAVPIVWTLWTGTTGGVLVSPKLVWSRMFSLGGQQGIKLLFVLGESGVSAPDLAGVYLGNNGLDTVSPGTYALWWDSSAKVDRADLLYGTQGGPAFGDPDLAGELFTTQAGPQSFSQALTPSNNTVFGVSNPVPNGTQYRVNYRIVSVPSDAEGKAGMIRDRQKVCGMQFATATTKASFPNGGIGYGYFRRQGIGGFSAKGSFSASVGTKIKYIISGTTLDRFYWGTSDEGGGIMDDINNTLNSECEASDELLKIGETLMINNSVWRVVERSLPIWLADQTQIVTLQCVEIFDDASVRVLAETQVTTTNGNNGGFSNLFDETIHAGSIYDNPVKASIASFKNTRPCDYTEIGIKSQVWGRFNGLCNFNSLYGEAQIRRLDKNNIAVQSGTMSDYFSRTSAFTLYYKAIGAPKWTATGMNFCVRGASPVDQFHTIGINHGGRRTLEFRLVPLTAARVARLGGDTVLYQLTGAGTERTLSGGGIQVRIQATPITVNQCSQLETMINNTETPRIFETRTGIAELSHYGSLITRSCDSRPEHQVVFLNEQLVPAVTPSFASLTTVALAAKSGGNLSNFDQLRTWIGSGINASNSFPELVLYMLQRVNGISSQLIDTASFSSASAYCNSRGLFFDGAIAERVNLRQYIADTAPFFLLNFVIANGKFSLMPAVPTGGPTISNLFTAGNIIEGSFSVDYLAADQRRDFQALVTYRTHFAKNELPVLRTYRARFADVPTTAPIESFDISQFCTSRNHAAQVGNYFLSVRRRVTHAVKFKTAHEGAGIAPGSYIKVALEQNVVSSFGNGVISSSNGTVSSATPLADGTYTIAYYVAGATDVQTASLTITGGIATNSQLWGALFTVTSSSVNVGTYLVEQIELDDDGLVSVTATEFSDSIASDVSGSGIIAEDT